MSVPVSYVEGIQALNHFRDSQGFIVQKNEIFNLGFDSNVNTEKQQRGVMLSQAYKKEKMTCKSMKIVHHPQQKLTVFMLKMENMNFSILSASCALCSYFVLVGSSFPICWFLIGFHMFLCRGWVSLK